MNSYHNKVLKYKESLKLFIDEQNVLCKGKNVSSIEFADIDYFVGILFLAHMNHYCKIDKIKHIHGYYVASSIMNLFIKIRHNTLATKDVLFFYDNIGKHMEYFNYRCKIDEIKIKINMEYYKFIVEITRYLNLIVNSNKNTDITEDIITLNNFFYILFITSKFIVTSVTKEPNLYKISEYYSNIFLVYLIISNNGKIEYSKKQLLFNNYIDHKCKLNYSLNEMLLKSETNDEIVHFIDNYLMKEFCN